MTDSDDDSLPNNVFTFQNDNTTISARGPNVNNTNITGLSFRNNVLTSTMHMPVNFERQRYGGSIFDQRSIYCRREMSPMSLRSVPNYGPPTCSRSIYKNGMGDQRSIYSGRGASPMSLRSIDSTTSVSAADIVFAFKNVKFNKYDLRIIKDAYNKLIKTRQRKRIEKRRNLKLFLKGTRGKSGEDSGEQGSDSSISSDDCRSVRTTICKENIPRLRDKTDVSHCNFNINVRDMNHMTNVSHYGVNMKETPIFTDCTQNIKQNTLRNMMAVNSSVSNDDTKERFVKTTTSQSQSLSIMTVQNTSVMTQKERFKKGFLLPSERFNKSVAGQAQVNNDNSKFDKSGKNKVDSKKPLVSESGSDQEEIFNSVSERNNQSIQRKRLLDNENCNSNKKRSKLNSPIKVQNSEPTETACYSIPNVKSKDFIFAKPKMPIKKGNMRKDYIPEKLLAKSRVPFIEEEIDFNYPQSSNKSNDTVNVEAVEDNTQSNIMHSNSDMSMRPSFIKRKLFTQKLDVAEQKNTSSDSVGINSPQNIYSASVRERNKTRKLVVSQSCLSREVPGEDNNVLDLIHKIVPPNQINITSVANGTESCTNGSVEVDNSNKWDVTAVIANCDNQDISDTYTDEEIFNVNYDKKSKKSKESTLDSMKTSQCKIVLQKLLPSTINKAVKHNKNSDVQTKTTNKETSKKRVTDCVKSFWDTDFESDMEFNIAPLCKTNIQHNQETLFKKQMNDLGDKQNGSNKKVPIPKGNILTVRNWHQSILNNSLKSYKIPASSDKIGTEVSNTNLVVQEKDITKVGKHNKETNSASQIGKKKDATKENLGVASKNKDSGRKTKAKECIDCINDTITKQSKKTIKDTKSTKHDDQSDYKKHVTKNYLNNCNPLQKNSHKSKDSKNLEHKLTDKHTSNTVIKSGYKVNSNKVKEPLNTGRIQPKRKSKEKSFIQSSTNKIASNTKATNKMHKTKTAKEFVSNNTSTDSINTIMTRSRDKLSFNSSQGDSTSINLSNISNRSLRLQQRAQRNRN